MADREVVVRLKAEIGQYKSAMNQAAASTERVGAAAKKSAATTTAASKQQASAAAAGATATAAATKKSAAASKTAAKATTDHVGALKSMGVMIGALGLAKFAKDSVTAFQTVTGEVSKMRRVTGGAPEDVSRLRSSLKMAGVDAAQFTKSAGLFSRKLVEAGKDSGKTAEMNKLLGTSFKDAQGNILPLTELLPRVGSTFKNMKDGPEKAALALTLFGRSGQAMLPWLNRGEQGIRELMAATSDSAIVTDAQIKKNADLLASQRRLDEAMTGLKMSFGEALVPVLTTAAGVATTLSNAFSSLSPQLQSATVYVGAAALAWRMFAPSIAAAKTALTSIGPLAGKSGKSLAIGTAAVVAATVAFNAYSKSLSVDSQPIEDLSASLGDFGRTGQLTGNAAKLLGGDFTQFGRSLAYASDDASNWVGGWKFLENAISATGIPTGLSQTREQVAQLDSALAQMNPDEAAAAFSRISSAAAEQGVGVGALASLFPKYTAAAAGSASGGSAPAADGIESVGEAAEAANGSVDEFASQLEALIAPGMAASKAADEQRNALDKLAESAKTNGTRLEGNSTAARNNREAVRGAIESNVSLATAYARLTGSVDQGKAKYDQASEALVRAGVKAGFSESAMRKFLASMNAVDGTTVDPKITAEDSALRSKLSDAKARLAHLRTLKTSPKVEADIRAAKRDVTAAQRALNNFRQRNKPAVGVNNAPANAGIQAAMGWGQNWASQTFWATLKTRAELGGAVGRARGGAVGFDNGGTVRGAGTKTSDSIPAWLSNGEYVIRADSVDKYGVEMFDRLNAGKYAKGGRAPKKTYKQKLAEWEARNKVYEDATAARNERISTRDSAASSRTSGVESTRSSFRGNSGVMTFDFGAYESARQASTNAIKAESDATAALFEARRKANSANRADRPQALRDLAAAQRTYADAARESAEATEAEAKAKPTSANILANFRDRVTKMQGLAGNLRTLAAWGMPSILLAEILNSGLESGSQMAAALVEGGPGDIAQYQSLAALQTFASTDLGNLNAAWNPGGGDLTLDQELANANAAIGPAPKGPGTKPVAKKKKKRALGGNVSRGEPYLVGERGMEMFVPGVSGTIVPARQLQTITANSGGGRDLVMSGPVQINLDGQGVWNGMLTANRRTGFTLRALDGSS